MSLKRAISAFALTLFVVASLIPLTAQAVSYSGTVVFDCTSISGGGTYTADRDNTGMGEEIATIEVVDGNGVILLSDTGTSPLGSFPLPPTIGNFTQAPTANPLTFRTISHAGNGLPEVVTVIAQGECAGLPYVVGNCTNPQPATFNVRNIPLATNAYFEPVEGHLTGFDLPSGNWYVGMVEKDFVEVWIACEASNIFVTVKAVDQPIYQTETPKQTE